MGRELMLNLVLQGGTECMGITHHTVRNDLHVHGKKRGMGSILEASGVLAVSRLDDRQSEAVVRGNGNRDNNRERPADVSLCRAKDVRTGDGRRGHGRIALDVGITFPQAAFNVAEAAIEQLGAAEQ